MSKRNTFGSVVVAAAVILTTILLPGRATAHTASTYYPDEWDDYVDVQYGFNTGFPQGQLRLRVWEAKTVWNNAAPDPAPEFLWTLADDVNHGNAQSACSVSGLNTGAVFWNDLDYFPGGALGITRIENLLVERHLEIHD